MKANKKILSHSEKAQVGVGTLVIFIAMVLVAAVAAAVLIQISEVRYDKKAQQTVREVIPEVSSNMRIESVHGWRAGTNQSVTGIVTGIDTMTKNIHRLDIRASLGDNSKDTDLSRVTITVTDGTTNNLRYINGVINTTGTTEGTSLLNTTPGYAGTYFRLEAVEGSTDPLEHFKVTYPDAHLAANVVYGAIGNAPKDRIGVLSSGTYFARADKFFIVDYTHDEDGSFTRTNPVMNKGDQVKISIFTAPDNADTTIGFPDLTNNETMGESSLSIIPLSAVSIYIVQEDGEHAQIDFVVPSNLGTKQSVMLYP